MNTKKATRKKVEQPKVVEEVVEEVNELLVMVDGYLTTDDIFVKDGVLNSLLKKVRDETATLVPDLTTPEGRKACAANAYNVSRCKTTIDKFGKDLVAGQKARVKVIDNQRKAARDYLDELKVEIRRPLTEWEAEQDAIAQAEADKAENEAAEAEAYEMNTHWENEKALREAREKLEKMEREAREREIREEAEEKARKQEREDAELRERRAREDAERRERENKEAEARRIKEAEERVRKEEADKAEKERLEREASEQRLLDEAERKEAEERARSANIEHRRGINNQIVERLVHHGFTVEQAQRFVTLVANNQIPSTSIQY